MPAPLTDIDAPSRRVLASVITDAMARVVILRDQPEVVDPALVRVALDWLGLLRDGLR